MLLLVFSISRFVRSPCVCTGTGLSDALYVGIPEL
jgi:hypothetical protein